MPLANDLSGLPRASTTVAGEPPDPSPRFVHLLVEKMAAANEAAGSKPTAMGTRVRHSDAGKCARAIAYKAAGIPESETMDLPGVWVTSLGTLIHQAWQDALQERYPDATIETKLRIDDLDASGHADAVIDFFGRTREEAQAAARSAHGQGGGAAVGVLGVDGGDYPQRLRRDREGVEGRGERARPSGDLRGDRGADPTGDAARSSVSESHLRQPGSSGTGDAEGEHPAGREPFGGARQEDPLPQGSSVRGVQPHGESAGLSDLPDVQVREEPVGARFRSLYELKTCGGFSYKMKVGERGEAEGPSHEHKLQAALNGLAVDADEIVIGYIATEAISKPAAARKHIGELGRFCAEWSYTREEFEPWARAEQARLQGILDLLDEGQLAARKVPNPEFPTGAEIVDPKTSRWEVRDADGTVVDTGSLWNGAFCSYCNFQTTCMATAPGRIALADVAVSVGAT
jgi:hypothetical protein